MEVSESLIAGVFIFPLFPQNFLDVLKEEEARMGKSQEDIVYFYTHEHRDTLGATVLHVAVLTESIDVIRQGRCERGSSTYM